MNRNALLSAAALLAGIAASPAAAQTTTTVASTTTTTAVPGACAPDDDSFTGLACRLDDLARAVRDARDAGALGRLGDGLMRRLESAETTLARAQSTCASGNARRAAKRLQYAARAVLKTRAVIRSNNGRKIIPADTGRRLAAQAAELGASLRRVRRSLTCP